MQYERLWVCGETAERIVSENVTRSLLGFKWNSSVKRTIPARTFDTRNGDDVPGNVKQAEAHWSAIGTILDIYFYPGEKIENPNFNDVVASLQGRNGLSKHQTLMCTIAPEGGVMINVEADCISIKYDDRLKKPEIVYQYTMKHELFVFHGPWNERVHIRFRDREQMEQCTHRLYSSEELPEKAA